MSEIRTRHFTISPNHPTYFIADIAANHDGSLDRAIRLIELAAQAGANAAKFQNFKAETIVSRNGFLELGNKIAHQSDWKKDVVEVYRDASIPLDWTDKLRDACHANGIDYFTAPYDLDFINFFKNKMEITKIGSGDITWKESLELIAKSNTYVILATGASTIKDVENAMGVLESAKQPIVLMQCNTNYTGNENNIRFLNLNVLTYFKHKYPEAILGLSDHTHGHLSVIAAVTLGARVIEKHFTDDVGREGPDHRFSMTSQTWTEMVSQTRELELALGDGVKKIEDNELESAIVQRRGMRYAKNISSGAQITHRDLIALRPCPQNAISPFQVNEIIGKVLNKNVSKDELVEFQHFQ